MECTLFDDTVSCHSLFFFSLLCLCVCVCVCYSFLFFFLCVCELFASFLSMCSEPVTKMHAVCVRAYMLAGHTLCRKDNTVTPT